MTICPYCNSNLQINPWSQNPQCFKDDHAFAFNLKTKSFSLSSKNFLIIHSEHTYNIGVYSSNPCNDVFYEINPFDVSQVRSVLERFIDLKAFQ